MALPPALQIEPIRSASVSTNRGLTLVVAGAVFSILVPGSMYLIELSQQGYLRRTEGIPKTVSLLLQDAPLGDGTFGSGGGLSPRAEKPEEPRNRESDSAMPTAVGFHTDLPRAADENVVPLEAPREIPKIAQIAPDLALAEGLAGIGIGNGRGLGTGNGREGGNGRGRGGAWIHSASSRDGIQVADAKVGVQDFIHPTYPYAAVVSRISGDVVIEVTIDEDGKPVQWTVTEGHPCLVAATLEFFPQWRFHPVRHQGERVRATFEVRVRFTLL